MVRLIVNADDYGRTPGVTAGIREAHQHGIVTSTTAMMNMPGVEEALATAQAQCPRLGLGVHLVLTAGEPLLPAAQVRSLTGGHDTFLRPPELASRLPALEYEELSAEWRTQVERFVAITGRPPDHLDAHHHIAYWTPLLLRALLELAREHRCAIRLPTGTEADKVAPDWAGTVRPFREWAPPLLDEFLPRHPDHLATAFYGSSATRTGLLELLAHLAPGTTTELMCHPGHADAALLAGSSYNRQREVELAILTDPAVAAGVRAQEAELISFAQL